MTQSQLERAFLTQWRRLAPHCWEPLHEYRFAAQHVGRAAGLRQRLKDAGLRDWRFDFAWPHFLIEGMDRGGVAVELDGGTWTRGRHTRGAGYRGDCEKLNAATSLGWRCYRVTTDMLDDDPAGVVAMIREALSNAT